VPVNRRFCREENATCLRARKAEQARLRRQGA
jgi:hypothetical protein